MSKHTEGPWSSSNWTGPSPEIAIHGANGDWIADVVVDQDSDTASEEAQQANARLIAAAPELLAVCEYVAAFGAMGSPLSGEQVRAIATRCKAVAEKAKGVPNA